MGYLSKFKKYENILRVRYQYIPYTLYKYILSQFYYVH